MTAAAIVEVMRNDEETQPRRGSVPGRKTVPRNKYEGYHRVRIDGPRGGELGLFQFLKQSKATLTYAMLVGHQFTNRITKLLTQAKRAKTK